MQKSPSLAFCILMDLIGLGGDERFAGFAGRIAHREEIDEVLGAWCAERTL